MLVYCLKRIGLAILTIFCIIAITFFSMNAIPGGPFDAEKAPSPEIKQVLMERYNLDKPLTEQFAIYLGNLLKGDFGVSIKTGRSITETILSSFTISMQIGLYAVIVALIFGLILGCIAAAFANRWPDRIIVSVTSVIVSVPSFVIASVLMLVFCLKLKWVSVWSATDPNYILPVISLAVFPMANIIRYTKSSMLDVLGQNYIRTARAKGVSESKVISYHAFRNTLIPIVTIVGGSIPGLFSGALITETLFQIPGIGYTSYQAMVGGDIPFSMFYMVFMAVFLLWLLVGVCQHDRGVSVLQPIQAVPLFIGIPFCRIISAPCRYRRLPESQAW